MLEYINPPVTVLNSPCSRIRLSELSIQFNVNTFPVFPGLLFMLSELVFTLNRKYSQRIVLSIYSVGSSAFLGEPMPVKRTTTRKVRELLCLRRSAGLSIRQISASTKVRVGAI